MKHVTYRGTDLRAFEARARRAVRRVSLIARKSRGRQESIDNFGEFMLIDPYSSCYRTALRNNRRTGDRVLQGLRGPHSRLKLGDPPPFGCMRAALPDHGRDASLGSDPLT